MGVDLGLGTFGDATIDAEGRPVTAPQLIRDIVDQGVLADRVGVHYFGIGASPRRLRHVRTPSASPRSTPSPADVRR